MTLAENKFTREELHLVLNTMGRLALNTDEKDCVGRVLADKKAKGTPINDQAIAIAISECRSKKSNNDDTHSISPLEKKILPIG
jgi:hypothetical protein